MGDLGMLYSLYQIGYKKEVNDLFQLGLKTNWNDLSYSETNGKHPFKK